jgi:hypothetical protein
MEYTVKWVIQVHAKNPTDAAIEAQRIMRDPESTATFFYVKPFGKTGSPKLIEL